MEHHLKLLFLYWNDNILVFCVFNIYLNLNNVPKGLHLLVIFRIIYFCFHLNRNYNQVGPSEKHWPIFRCWSLPCSKNCILVLENSVLMQLSLSHTIIKSKNWNAKKYMVVLTPKVSTLNFWKLISVKETNF